jgi:hypothetical protein
MNARSQPLPSPRSPVANERPPATAAKSPQPGVGAGLVAALAVNERPSATPAVAWSRRQGFWAWHEAIPILPLKVSSSNAVNN